MSEEKKPCQMEIRLRGQWCLASRIERLWNFVMESRGWFDYCDSTTQFNYISYNYTKDAPEEVVLFGEELWQKLMESFDGEDDMGEVHLGKSDLSSVTRRSKLWHK